MNQSLSSVRLGFLGAGQMATAWGRGLIQRGIVLAENILATEIVAAAAARFCEATGGTIVDEATLLARCSVIILAVKPQHVQQALRACASHWHANHLLISIAAGITLQQLEEYTSHQSRVVRVMPNTPCLIGCGASAFSRGSRATAEDAELVSQLLSSVGIAREVPETWLDAITGLSGSGPAYGYLMIEALADGGVRMGLPRDLALQFAAQTMLGAARMVLETGQHPAVLKDAVTSPGGTTIAGLQVLETHAVRGALISAVQTATQRSRELSQG